MQNVVWPTLVAMATTFGLGVEILVAYRLVIIGPTDNNDVTKRTTLTTAWSIRPTVAMTVMYRMPTYMYRRGLGWTAAGNQLLVLPRFILYLA